MAHVSLPNNQQVGEWFDAIHSLWSVANADDNRKLIDRLERNLTEYLDEDRRGGVVVVDGYPTCTMSGRGGNGTLIDPDHPELGTVSLTSVEAAALARPQRDVFHDHVEHAVDFLLQAVHSLGAFQARMAAIRQLRGEGDVRNERWCESHLASLGREVPITRKLKHASDVAGRLARPRLLCGACYQFVLDHDRLPTKAEFPAPGKTRWRVRQSA